MPLTAANGDQLLLLITGTRTMDPSYTFSEFSGMYVITGGTGRLASATGMGTITAHLAIAEGYIHGDLTGSIEGNLITSIL